MNAYYYATRDPLGASGDFTTAPEISQMFGEMIGACLADAWKRAGAPADAIYAELGPGGGRWRPTRCTFFARPVLPVTCTSWKQAPCFGRRRKLR